MKWSWENNPALQICQHILLCFIFHDNESIQRDFLGLFDRCTVFKKCHFHVVKFTSRCKIREFLEAQLIFSTFVRRLDSCRTSFGRESLINVSFPVRRLHTSTVLCTVQYCREQSITYGLWCVDLVHKTTSASYPASPGTEFAFMYNRSYYFKSQINKNVFNVCILLRILLPFEFREHSNVLLIIGL